MRQVTGSHANRTEMVTAYVPGFGLFFRPELNLRASCQALWAARLSPSGALHP